MSIDWIVLLLAWATGMGVGLLCNCPMVFGLMFRLSGYCSLKHSILQEKHLPVNSLVIPAMTLSGLAATYYWVGASTAMAILLGLILGNLISLWQLWATSHNSSARL